MAATKTGASWEDVWKKVSEVQPGESREKTKQKVRRQRKSDDVQRAPQQLWECGGRGLGMEKHLQEEADACKGME